MPFYDYKCKVCLKTFEVFHGFKETIEEQHCDCLEPIYEKVLNTSISLSMEDDGPGKRIRHFIEEARSSLKEHTKEIKRKSSGN